MPHRIKIGSTKKILPAQKKLLVEAGFALSQSDFIETRPIDFNLEQINDNLIFTSQNAIKSVVNHPEFNQIKHKNIFCVGQKSKELLTKNGCNVIAYSEYATDLAELITLVYSNESCTFFSGNLRRDALPLALKKAKVNFNEIQVYETVLTPKKNTVKQNGLLFFSPSAVDSYIKKNKITDEVCFCIGQTTAKALIQKRVNKIVMASHPTVEDLIAVVIEYYQP